MLSSTADLFSFGFAPFLAHFQPRSQKSHLLVSRSPGQASPPMCFVGPHFDPRWGGLPFGMYTLSTTSLVEWPHVSSLWLHIGRGGGGSKGGTTPWTGCRGSGNPKPFRQGRPWHQLFGNKTAEDEEENDLRFLCANTPRVEMDTWAGLQIGWTPENKWLPFGRQLKSNPSIQPRASIKVHNLKGS